ncbi:MAG: hypothetical protein WBW53_15560 [Terriglobales bacterium]
MRASRRVLVVILACLSSFCLSNACLSTFAVARQSDDQLAAEGVLGPQWKQLSRRAGMIFAGTVLVAESPTGISQNETRQPGVAQTGISRGARPVPGTTPAVQLCFQVDEAIAGVERGQILTIHEWAGAWSRQRPMNKGQHVLIFLYPPSRLGFTSPVGGSMGRIDLDSTGKHVAQRSPAAALAPQHVSADTSAVSVIQLERAIRSAREE